ncbi:sortase domain-bontaining protein [Pimelobacter simplex]|uniref:DUF7507 domain-containing protein n=1 Tax=Nocardioides simplex TaxID=2045 RepID=UPI003AAFF6A2
MKKALSGLALALVAGTATVVPVVALSAPATAAPGDPGVPSDPAVLFTEDFENGVSATPSLLADYVGANGLTYTADPYYLDDTACNGVIFTRDADNQAATGCSPSNNFYNWSRAFAQALGEVQTPANPAGNHAVVDFTTSGASTAGMVHLETENTGSLAVQDRFLSFSIDVAEAFCNQPAGRSRLSFYLLDGGTAHAAQAAPVVPCTDPGMQAVSVTGPGDGGNRAFSVGTVNATGSVLFSGTQFGFRVVNDVAVGGGGGNDVAFDNLRVLDVTPQLDKSFQTGVPAGFPTTMTFTVTNTSELGSKNGWSFTENLPAGVKIAPAPRFTTTCTNGAVTAGGTAGASSVGFKGDLDAGQESCTITIDVVTDAAKQPGDEITSEGTDSTDLAGLEQPGEATLEVGTRSLPQVDCLPAESRATQRWWYFGNGAGLDFTAAGTAVPTTPATSTGIASAEGTTVVSDVNGALQFWANGTAIFNKLHAVMPNGGGLTGNVSATQTVAAFPSLDQEGIYFVVTTSGAEAVNGQLRYSVVDMALDGGKGDVTATKNVDLGPANGAAEGLTALPNANGTGFWVIAAQNSSPNVRAYLFDGTGPADPDGAGPLTAGDPVISVMPTNNLNQYSSFNLSPDLSRVLMTSTQGGGNETTASKIRLLDFDAATGQFAQRLEWASATTAGSGQRLYTADFSPSGDYVYATKIFDAPHLWRYKIAGAADGAAVKATEEHVGALTGTGGQVRRGPDGRMYAAGSGSATLSVVNAPDQADVADVDFASGGVTLAAGTTSRFGLPQMVTGCPRTAGLELVKTAAITTDNGSVGKADAGDVITYTFTVTNSGRVAASDVTIDDPMPGLSAITPASVATLAPDDDAVFTATYTVAASDVANGGFIENTAVAEGTDPDGGELVTPPGLGTTVKVPIAEHRDLFGACGQPVTFDADNGGWRVATTDSGTTTVLPPAASGWLAGAGNPGGALRTTDLDGNWTEFWSPDLTAGDYTQDYSSLAGKTLQFDYRNNTGIGYDIYLAIRGTNGQTVWFNFRPQIVNSQAWNRVRVPVVAARWRTGFNNGSGVANGSPAPSQAALDAILASVDRFAISAEGQVGQDITLVDNFGLSCSDMGDAPASYGTTGGEAAAHGITDYDADAGTAQLMIGSRIDDESDGLPGAAADGDDTDGTADEDGLSAPVEVLAGAATEVEVEVTNDSAAAATLAGWLDLNENGTFDAGERSNLVTVPAASGTTMRTLTFPVAAADLSDDSYLRVRLFAGTVADPAPTGAVDGGEVEDHLVVGERTEVSLDKTAELTTDGGTPDVADKNDVITYTFTVTNSGNQPVTDVTIDDLMPGLSAITPASVATLAPGADAVFTATYTVTQADVDEGGDIANSATAGAEGPDGGVTSPPSEVEVPLVPAAPSLLTDKEASLQDTNGNGKADKGEKIAYSFTVRNDGNVTVAGVSVDDPMVSGISPATATIAPGGNQVFTADLYTVTQADIDNGGPIVNRASASGTAPGGGEVTSPEDTTSTDTVTRVPGLSVDKSAALTTDEGTDGVADKDDVITYTFVVENTGNVTMTNVAIADALPGLSPTSPLQVATLAPGASTTFTATYVVTQADVDEGGEVHNSATAKGKGPDGAQLTSEPDTTDTDLVEADPGLSIDKTALLADANDNDVADKGEVITYSFLVENTGNVTMHGVAIDDPMPGLSATTPASVATLAPGASVVFTATYTVRQSDVDAGGSVSNAATAGGTAPGGEEITSVPDETDTSIVPGTPGLAIDKLSALDDTNGNGKADLGEEITYTFEVENTGNVTATDVEVTDPEVTGITPASATMAPGETVTFTADPYVVTQGDIDDGVVHNVAAVEGKLPPNAGGGKVGSEDVDEVDTIVAHPDVSVVKESELTVDAATLGKADVDDVITYTFTVRNDGGATAFDVSVADALPGLSAVSPASLASLAPGQTATFTATYTVKRADVKRGGIDNTASVTSRGPTRGGVTPEPVSAMSNPVTNETGTLGGPVITTKASAAKVAMSVGKGGVPNGVRLHDVVTISGFVTGGDATGTATLYGPVAKRSAGMCTPGRKVGSVAFVPRNGTVRTPAITVSKPGYYTWVVATTEDRRNDAASHACGLAAETTLVHRAEVGKVKIETGFTGPVVAGRKVRPASVSIPAIGMRAPLDVVGVAKGSMVIPENVRRGGWLMGSAAPGEVVGATVIAGHVSDRHDRPGAFGKLNKAKVGQVVTVRGTDGTVQRYRITKVYTQKRAKGFTGGPVSTTGAHQLTLVTCTGKVRYSNGRFHYTKNQVVIATPIG